MPVNSALGRFAGQANGHSLSTQKSLCGNQHSSQSSKYRRLEATLTPAKTHRKHAPILYGAGNWGNQPGTFSKNGCSSASPTAVPIKTAFSHCRYSEYEMSNKYRKFDATLFVRKAMRDRKEMKAELNELRYFLDRNVERRTEQLLKRITLLESCNATLCCKLTLAEKEIAALKQLPALTLPRKSAEQRYCAMKPYVMSNQAQKAAELIIIQGKWGKHATAT